MAVILYSTVNMDAMSLKETLASNNTTMEFGNSGTIWCEYKWIRTPSWLYKETGLYLLIPIIYLLILSLYLTILQ